LTVYYIIAAIRVVENGIGTLVDSYTVAHCPVMFRVVTGSLADIFYCFSLQYLHVTKIYND